ncbi:MAG TPA: YbaK/EbsC family protein [Deltaproteobacteria bacterium]|nr:YbaK/EbsC family protein [Deltaproteobacteria bacterium]
MGVEDVRRFFAERGLDYAIKEFDEGTQTVDLAARALGVEPALIAKTLALRVGDQAVILVTKGDARLDNRKFKQRFGVKARMLGAQEVVDITGHPVGGVCPFGLKNPMDVYLDESLKPFALVYPAAGAHNNCIAIAPDELCRVTGARWVDVCS